MGIIYGSLVPMNPYKLDPLEIVNRKELRKMECKSWLFTTFPPRGAFVRYRTPKKVSFPCGCICVYKNRRVFHKQVENIKIYKTDLELIKKMKRCKKRRAIEKLFDKKNRKYFRDFMRATC